METQIALLRLWHRGVLKPYKICQNLTKWNFTPPPKCCLELRALPFFASKFVPASGSSIPWTKCKMRFILNLWAEFYQKSRLGGWYEIHLLGRRSGSQTPPPPILHNKNFILEGRSGSAHLRRPAHLTFAPMVAHTLSTWAIRLNGVVFKSVPQGLAHILRLRVCNGSQVWWEGLPFHNTYTWQGLGWWGWWPATPFF